MLKARADSAFNSEPKYAKTLDFNRHVDRA